VTEEPGPPLEPSPKDQLNVYAPVPPVALPVNVIVWLVWGNAGVNVKLVVSPDEGVETVIV